nr:RsmD family RNA methyltransferase [Sphingomonas vulcanisoli]
MGATTRPTSDRTREALFSMLTSRIGSFEDLRIADVFAGTGALGLEAQSRGAAHAIFIDHDIHAIAAIRRNVATFGASGDILPIAVSLIGKARSECDILFFDPPYGSGGAGALLEKMTRLGWASPSAWAAIETAANEEVSAGGWNIDATRTYGKARLTVLARQPSASPD